jgi:hypothetical protein
MGNAPWGLAEVALAFVEMAHRIVWYSAATVDSTGRPWSRVLHPIWDDPAIIPPWRDGRQSPAFGALRLEPWRSRGMPGTAMTAGTGAVLTWSARPPPHP